MSKVQYEATVSMHAFCREVLNLSECEAYLRIAAARASRQHPMILEMLRDGRLHLSGIERLSRVLTVANRDALLERAAYKSKREIERIIVEFAPQPDVAATIRKLPTPRTASPVLPKHKPTSASEMSKSLRPNRAIFTTPEPDATPASTVPVPAKRPVVEPIAPTRYRVQFTASATLHEKLSRLQSLMRSSVPDGDLAQLIEEAVTEKLERLEARRFGKTSRPRKSLEQTDTTPTSRHIPAAVRRAVYERDGGQCTFVDERGRRCTARDRLEFDHLLAYGRGGDHSATNIALSCSSHNQYRADLDYGSAKMRRHRSGVSEPLAGYSVCRSSQARRASAASSMVSTERMPPDPAHSAVPSTASHESACSEAR